MAAEDEALELRPPDTVMRLARMGSFHQTRISFMRSLLRRIAQEEWRLTCPRFDLDAEGYGTAVYRVELPAGVCSLVAFSDELSPEERTDRVIAEKWDATFALCHGEPSDADIERLRANVPRQEAGHVSARELVLSRANKSVRLFGHVVDCLAHGWQPSMEDIVRVGYLMRTTAVYGNGKFGLSDLANTFAGGLFSRPFEAELFTVYLIREFTLDLVEHIAAARNPERAVALAPDRRRALGIGNSTGLGMAPFLTFHPALIHRWMLARETALARVLALAEATPGKRAAFLAHLARAIDHVGEWSTQDARQAARTAKLGDELEALHAELTGNSAVLCGPHPWRHLMEKVESEGSLELQELIVSLMLEPYGELVDDLADQMADPEPGRLDPAMTLAALRSTLERDYAWALDMDFAAPEAQHYFWYRSAEKEEPRLGERFNEPGAELESRIGVARDAAALHRLLTSGEWDGEESVAGFLLCQPQWRHMVKRVQLAARTPYGEIRDNLLGEGCLPIDILRCKLSFFGAIKFDPKSDRWTRITMYQGAPGFAELNRDNADSWAFPVFTEPADLHP
ncbi:MAG: hypothetical protein R3285_04575 [Kiloniellales bacterium]|nr:hypothetical protein [Kiloniellales bacterium]